MFLWLIHRGFLAVVHLEFMLPGHSMMPCDRSFGVLEKEYKKLETINHPNEYINIISRSTNSHSTSLGYKDFIDFKSLLQFIQFRKAKTVLFSKSRRIILDSDYPWSMLLITPTGTERVNLNRRENEGPDGPILNLPELVAQKYSDPSSKLPLKYKENTQLLLAPAKLLHLKQMRPYLDSPGRIWVDSVTLAQQTAVPRPRVPVPANELVHDSAETLPADYFDDEYTSVPDPNFPPDYVETVRLEDPPPHLQASTSRGDETPSHSQASTSRCDETPSRSQAPISGCDETPHSQASAR